MIGGFAPSVAPCGAVWRCLAPGGQREIAIVYSDDGPFSENEKSRPVLLWVGSAARWRRVDQACLRTAESMAGPSLWATLSSPRFTTGGSDSSSTVVRSWRRSRVSAAAVIVRS